MVKPRHAIEKKSTDHTLTRYKHFFVLFFLMHVIFDTRFIFNRKVVIENDVFNITKRTDTSTTQVK